jgi:hypothetical protein
MKYIWLFVIIAFGALVYQTTIDTSKIKYDTNDKIAYLYLDSQYTNGSDGACQGAGMLILQTLNNLPDGWKVYITNDWVPSSVNPIDKEWAKILAQGY